MGTHHKMQVQEKNPKEEESQGWSLGKSLIRDKTEAYRLGKEIMQYLVIHTY